MKKNYSIGYKLLAQAIFVLMWLLPWSMSGQTTVTLDPGSTSWTVPAGVTSVTIKVWGAGGSGGGTARSGESGGGGGGGGYTTQTVAVTPGAIFNFYRSLDTSVAGIGVGGAAPLAGNNNGNAGGRTRVVYNLGGIGPWTCEGGAGGLAPFNSGGWQNGSGGAGGNASGGSTNINGSSGGVGVGGSSGGAGGASNGLTGGAGGVDSNGVLGSNTGTGGGGADTCSGGGCSNRAGGGGANGRVQFTYTLPVVSVAGNGITIANGSVAVSVADYTDFSTLNLRQFDIINGTAGVVTISSITIGGADAADFSITNFTAGSTISAGGTDLFNVRFSPSVACVNATAKNATITVNYNDGAAKTYTYAIRGTCYNATNSVTGNAVAITNGASLAAISTANNTNYGNVPTNFVSTKTFVMTNTGTKPFTVTSITSSLAKFTIASGGGASTVLGNSSGSFTVAYAPTASVSDNATITIVTSLGNYTFVVAGVGVAPVLVPGCLGDPGTCTSTTSSSFNSSFAGWTNSGTSPWIFDATQNGVNAARFNEKNSKNGAGLHASMSQNITGLDANSSTLLVKLKVKIVVQPCNATGRSFDLNVKFAGVTYLNINLTDTNLDATLNLQNGGLLVATDLSEIRTWFNAGGCDTTNRVNDFTTVFLSIPKGVATSGALAVTVENTGTTGSTQFHQMDIYMGEVEATSNGGACGFLWLNAGAISAIDGAEVTTWPDSSSGGKNATGTAGTSPSLQFNAASHFNFNPSLSFSGSKFLKGSGGYASSSQFAVFKHAGLTSATARMTLIGTVGTYDLNDRTGLKLGSFSSNFANELYGTLRGDPAGVGSYAVGGGSGTVRNGIIYSTIQTVVAPASPTSWTVTRNGNQESRVSGGAASGFQNWANVAYSIGASANTSSYTTFFDFLTGEIAEILTYPAVLSTAESQKVQTYLGIKYGITLGHNYVNGAGVTVYDVSTYGKRVFGIGRESCQGLHQRQSASRDDNPTTESMLTIGYNSLIGTLNASTTGNDVPDNAFVMIGDDNGSRASWTATGAPVTELRESTRIAREFKMKVTGAPVAPIRFKLDGTMLPAVAATERIAIVIANSSANIANATFAGPTNKIYSMTKSGSDWVANINVSAYTTAYFAIVKYEDCYTDLICSGTTKTWSGSWSPAGAPTVNDPVIINAAYNTATVGAGFTCCTLTINAPLTIANAGLVEVQSNITNNSTITIQNSGSLMQYYDNATNSGAGSITITRDSQPMYRGDYTYWSSPVSGFNMSSIPSSGFRFYWDATYTNGVTNGKWTEASGIMNSGQGYIIMTDNVHATNSAVTSVTFSGTMYNGRVSKSIYSTPSKWNLVGNPYPSALNADDFITENVAAGRTTGGLYFWTHNTRINGFNTGETRGNFTQSDYAVYTLAGGAGTARPGTVTTPVSDGGSVVISYGGNTVLPTGYIAAGQAFFVEGIANSTVLFKNCMRTRISGNNNNFYKSTKTNNTDVKNRFWLDVQNENGSYKQLLMGYFREAKDVLDGFFDAEMRNGTNTVQLYTMTKDQNGEKVKLTIQGKNADSFNENEIVPIGFRMSGNSGSLNKISLSDYEGVFDTTKIYLEDKLLQTIHDLNSGPYSFEANIDEDVEDRFVLRFQNKSIQNEGTNSNLISNLTVSTDKNTISVVSKSSEIRKINVYNALGKRLFTSDEIVTMTYDISSIQPSNSMHIIEVYLNDGAKVTRKVMY